MKMKRGKSVEPIHEQTGSIVAFRIMNIFEALNCSANCHLSYASDDEGDGWWLLCGMAWYGVACALYTTQFTLNLRANENFPFEQNNKKIRSKISNGKNGIDD